MRVRSLGWEDPLEEDMAMHSSILAWRISQTEEPGGLQSLESESRARVKQQHGHVIVTSHLWIRLGVSILCSQPSVITDSTYAGLTNLRSKIFEEKKIQKVLKSKTWIYHVHLFPGRSLFTVFCRYCVSYIWKVCGNPCWSKSISTIFSMASVHFIFLCHILLILTIY